MTIREYYEFRCNQALDDMDRYFPQKDSNGNRFIYNQLDLLNIVSNFINNCKDVDYLYENAEEEGQTAEDINIMLSAGHEDEKSRALADCLEKICRQYHRIRENRSQL